ncbi:MAG: histidine kinase [Syntrophomonadaceae bacterium]|nr:histidine kinase [Syntrophomonadaceae bacterium]
MLDIKALESIVKQMTDSIDKSRSQIFEIAENARKEYYRIQSELIETREQALEIIQKVDLLEKEEKISRQRLMEVSRDFTRYSEEDIHKAYDLAKNIQIQISVLREKEIFLRQRRDDLERSLKRLEGIVQRAEVLMAQVGMMLKFIGRNLQDVTSHLDKFQKRQQLGWWVIQAQEEERRRVAREIHDGTAQALTNIFLRLEFCEKMWDQDLHRVRRELVELKDMVRGNLQDLRRIIFDLRPQALDDLGLIPTLKRYTADFKEQYQIPVHLVTLGQDKRLQPYLEVALFRLIQEALSNIRKHAEATEAIIKIEQTPSTVTTLIKDNGQGFDLESVQTNNRDHYGLIHMRERAEILNGEFHINTTPGKGTEIFIKIPLKNSLNFDVKKI